MDVSTSSSLPDSVGLNKLAIMTRHVVKAFECDSVVSIGLSLTKILSIRHLIRHFSEGTPDTFQVFEIKAQGLQADYHSEFMTFISVNFLNPEFRFSVRKNYTRDSTDYLKKILIGKIIPKILEQVTQTPSEGSSDVGSYPM
jgi:hypothetical protein